MAGRQMGQKDKRSGMQQEADLGQKEAQLQKRKESDLSRLGEKSRQTDRNKDKGRSQQG